MIEDPAYLGLQGGVTLGSRRSLGRISTPGDMSVIGRRGDRQDFADRLDPMRDGCSPSWSRTIRTARARTSGENLLLVCFVMAPPSQELEPPINPERFNLTRSKRLVRCSRRLGVRPFSLVTESVGTPARRPLSTSAFFTHSLSVCAVQAISAATAMSQPRDDRQDDLFRPALEKIIDLRHPLVRLAGTIDWDFLARRLSSACRVGPGQPPLPTRLVGLFILKHMHNLSDEVLCDRWVKNPYFQYFCGEVVFRHEAPFDRSSLTRWRQRLGEEIHHRAAAGKAFRWRTAPVRSRSTISSGWP